MFRRCVCFVMGLLPVLLAGPVLSSEREFDTDRLFSFNTGSDLGEAGEKELQLGFAGMLGRGSGSYQASQFELTFQYTPVETLQISFSGQMSAHHIQGVPDFEDRNSAAFSGLSFGLAYRLLDRVERGVGLSVFAQPHVSRVDDDSGAPVRGFGSDFGLALDRELVPGRVVAVLNLLYRPEEARFLDDNSYSRSATTGLTGGVTFKLAPRFFAGFEAQYLRKYNSFDFGAYAGDAFFLGPSLSVHLGERGWLSAGWNVQLAGRSTTVDGAALNQTDFSHHLVRMVWGLEF